MELTPGTRTNKIIMKTIKLTTEQAQQLYAKDPTFRETILHEFTDEELGIEPKPLTWYDLGNMKGAWINWNSEIVGLNHRHLVPYSREENRNIYPCRQDAEQALAKCMVLQLARHYNKCEQHEIEEACYKCYYDKGANTVCVFKSPDVKDGSVKFLRKSDLEKCIKDNEDLFKKMLGVK
jgi:hypothetical protein